ncbi:hypothetical protein PRIPAC_81263 [Pristionchus pacificus]|uniref:Uncharacterized protein n=1 Tax=Pristionchus pacificus TaxID=54126 RepID=A0A2A6C4K2_PRIPA|nr:hypothetical protein PRIPAC_81263 [Pristionchus pacificus]|eukprot:PDM73046.1 hypothetical protein PRIPAC_39480 [Pristionchus pacificus]
MVMDEISAECSEREEAGTEKKAERSEVTRAQYVTAKSDAKRAVSIAKTAASQKLYESLDTTEGEMNIYRIARSTAAAAIFKELANKTIRASRSTFYGTYQKRFCSSSG